MSITAVSSHPSPRRAHLPSSTQTPPSSPWKGQSLEEARGELLRQVQSLDQLAWVDFGSINGLRPEWWPAHKVSVKELFRRNAYHRYKGREICPFPSAPSPPPGLAHPATPRSDHILGAPFGPRSASCAVLWSRASRSPTDAHSPLMQRSDRRHRCAALCASSSRHRGCPLEGAREPAGAACGGTVVVQPRSAVASRRDGHRQAARGGDRHP